MEHPPSSPDPLQNGYHVPAPQRPVSQPQTHQQTRPPEPPPEPDPDYAVLLLSLADEYFEAARKLKSRSEDYYKLIATALGCIESVLNNFNLDALREAQLSLRYAQVLLEETENYDEAEGVLSKAIELCDRNKFLDLKYSLQLVLSCVLFESKPKAAVKDLTNLLEEVDAYKHAAWGYALRYQLVTFHLSSTPARDIQQAIHQVAKIIRIAGGNGDKAVIAFCAVAEALLHLQTSHQDAVKSAQLSIATARSALADSKVASITQIAFMVGVVDLCCSMRESNVTEGDQKRKQMQEVFGTALDDTKWQESGSTISLPLLQACLRGLPLQKGGIVQQIAGQPVLQLSWLALEEAEIIGFLLSAASKARRTANDRDRVQKFIDEGLKSARELAKDSAQSTSPEQTHKCSRMKLLECKFLIEQAFLQLGCGDWRSARTTAKTLSIALSQMDSAPKSLHCITRFIEATTEHGEGNLDEALQIYQLPDFTLTQPPRQAPTSTPSQTSSRSDAENLTVRNISILAALNTLLIINHSSHPLHSHRSTILEQVTPLIPLSGNAHISASFKLIHSHITSSHKIVLSKDQLVKTLNLAKSIANMQITAMTLTVMQQSFFRGVTDEHANKCVKAAVVNTKQWGNGTWAVLAQGVEAESLEFRGEVDGARRAREEEGRRWDGLPEGVKEQVMKDRG